LAYDIGAFVFDPAHEYLQTFPDLIPMMVPVSHHCTSLQRGGMLGPFPFSIAAHLRQNGRGSFALDLLDVARCKLTARRRRTVREYCTYYLGSRLYESSGLRYYVERLYGLPEDQLSLDFAHARLFQLAEQCGLRRNGPRVLARGLRGDRSAPWECLVRPREGFGPIYARLRSTLEQAGVTVSLGADISSIRPEGAAHALTSHGQTRTFDLVVSTIPMDSLAALTGVTLPFHPRTMTLVSLFYRFTGAVGFDGHCLYNYAPDGAWKRAVVFSNYYGTHEGEHYFTVECTIPGDAPVDLEATRRAFEAHIAGWPVFRGRLSWQGGVATPRAYPVLRAGEEEAIRASRQLLGQTGILLAGRQGRFAYTSSAGVSAEARHLVEALAEPQAAR
jgi:protoporphyrinogen oxidase